MIETETNNKMNERSKVSRSSMSPVFKLESLPPTAAAAKFHSYHAYLALQQWIGNNLCPSDWGWQYRDGSLVPITADRPVSPTRVLRIVSCGCKTGCRKICGCRKAGVYCSPMCSHCNGQSCCNINTLALSQDSDDDPYRCECDNYSWHVSVFNFGCTLLRSFILLFVSVSIIYASTH